MIGILIVDDDINIQKSLKAMLSDEGYHSVICGSGEECLKEIENKDINIVFLDVMLPGIDGIETLKRIRKNKRKLKIIMISGHADLSTAVEATKLGAYDFFEKPLNPDKILLELKNLSDQIEMQKRITHLEGRVRTNDEMVGNCKEMRKLNDKIEKSASSEGRVLIFGENGSGKELVAKALHNKSKRKRNPFISLNCAAFPKDLVESELFGYERGAFTGAVKNKPGKFQIADQGTLFLDEIADMSLETQAKLLRVLEENEVTRLGSNKIYKFDVRIISATNKNLLNCIEQGSFRSDLYYRLNVIPIEVPPLRDRTGDISLLAVYFLKMFSANTGKGILEWSAEALDILESYKWPGNVRELKNFIERMVILTDSDIIAKEFVIENLPSIHSSLPEMSLPANKESKMSLKEMVKDFERKVLIKEYKESKGNVSKIARILKVDRANLHRKLKNYGIKKNNTDTN